MNIKKMYVLLFFSTMLIYPIHDFEQIDAMLTKLYSTHSIQRNGFLIGLGASAAFILSQWLFSENDLQLITRAQRLTENLYTLYEDMITYLDIRYVSTSDSFSMEQFINNATEQEMYDFALFMWQRRKGYEELQEEIMKGVSTLSSLLYTLDTREHQLEEEHFHHRNYEEVIEQMRHFIKHVLFVREKLNMIKRYVMIHSTYFSLFEMDGYLRNKYQTPIDYTVTYQNNHYECAFKVRDWALSQETIIGSFHTIVKELRKDITNLQKTIVRTNSNYQHRISTAQQLRDTLTYIKSLLTIDPLYSQETAYTEWQQIQQS